VQPLSGVVVLVVGVGLFELLRHALIDTGNPNLLPALVLVGAAVVPAAFTAFVYGRRLPFAVTGGLLAATAVLGGVIGIVVAGTLEYDTLRRLGTLPMVAVGLIEETAKLLVPAVILLVLVSRHRLNAVDGLLIGVASGAGFAALETMGYAFVQLIATQGSLSAVDGVLLLTGTAQPSRAHGVDRSGRGRVVGGGSIPVDRAIDCPSGRRVRRGRGLAHRLGQHRHHARLCGTGGDRAGRPRLCRAPARAAVRARADTDRAMTELS
jgi:PrsW family intramembrane metalloprotease